MALFVSINSTISALGLETSGEDDMVEFVSINSTFSALELFTSGEDDMVETRRAVNDRNRVTSIPILPGTI